MQGVSQLPGMAGILEQLKALLAKLTELLANLSGKGGASEEDCGMDMSGKDAGGCDMQHDSPPPPTAQQTVAGGGAAAAPAAAAVGTSIGSATGAGQAAAAAAPAAAVGDAPAPNTVVLANGEVRLALDQPAFRSTEISLEPRVV